MTQTLTDDTKVPNLLVGSGALPPVLSGGSGPMSTANKPNGSIHMRTDELPEVRNGGAAEQLGLGQHAVEMRIGTLAAGTATTYKTYMPRKGVITGVSRRFDTAPATGNVTTDITVAGNSILASGSEDETGISADTLTAHSLTGTSAYLDAAKGAEIEITVTSDDGGMTGGANGNFFLYYNDD